MNKFNKFILREKTIDDHFHALKRKYLDKSKNAINEVKVKENLLTILNHEDFDRFVSFFDMNNTDFDRIILTSLTKGIYFS